MSGMYACVKAAGYEPDEVYKNCVRLLSQSVISSAAFEPPGLKEGGFVQQKGQPWQDEAMSLARGGFFHLEGDFVKKVCNSTR